MVCVAVGWAGVSVCVCVCMRESLLPQEIVWMESFVCWRHRAFTHSAKQAGRSLAQSSTWPLWWDDAQTHDLVPRVRLQVCEGERGDVQCAVFLCMYVGVWRCRTDLQTWGVFAHFKEWHNQKLAKTTEEFKVWWNWEWKHKTQLVGLCGSDWSFSLLLCARGDINHWQTRQSPTYSFLYCELSLISFITGETTKLHKKQYNCCSFYLPLSKLCAQDMVSTPE